MKPKVLFLGPKTSFSGQATRELYNHDEYDLVPCASFEEIFSAIQKIDKEHRQAVIPFQNSTNGFVLPVLDLMGKIDPSAKLEIQGEHQLRIRLSLLGFENFNSGLAVEYARPTDLSLIQRIYSHPQAFTQCSRFLAKHLARAEWVEASSTAQAAELAVQDLSGRSVALASKHALNGIPTQKNGFQALYNDIEDESNNVTRFLIIGRNCSQINRNIDLFAAQKKAKQKALVAISIPQRSRADLGGNKSQECQPAMQRLRTLGFRINNVISRPGFPDVLSRTLFVEYEVWSGPSEKSAWYERCVESVVADVCKVLGCPVRGRCRLWGIWNQHHLGFNGIVNEI